MSKPNGQNDQGHESQNEPTDPAPDPLEAAIRELILSSMRKNDAIGGIGREMDAAIKSFAGAHGHRAAAEEKTIAALARIEADQKLLRNEVRRVLERLGPLELEVSSQREELRAMKGNGHGGG